MVSTRLFFERFFAHLAAQVLALSLFWIPMAHHASTRLELRPRPARHPGEPIESIYPESLDFPTGFMWGVAVAGHQVEGDDTTSSWARWEATGHTQQVAGVAIDDWDLYADDMRLAAETGATAYRMSIEWSRVEPRRGVFDQAALARYVNMIDMCRSLGMEPIVTLYHFAYPAWLDTPTHGVTGPLQARGWARKDAVAEYSRFVKVVAKALKGKVHYWITVNEPNVEPALGYLLGIFPPGELSPIAYEAAIGHLEEAHVAAYDILHAEDPGCAVSTNMFRMVRRSGMRTTTLLPGLDPAQSMLDKLTHWRDHPGDPPRSTLDYIAFDYYYAFATLPEIFQARTYWKWPIYPEGLYDAAEYYYHRYHLPELVAENGMATHNDMPRKDGWTRSAFLVNHLYELHRAIANGVPVIGYCYWSLMDNYEWGSYAPTFGLYEVDRANGSLARIPTPAVAVYREIATSDSLPISLLSRYLGRKS